MRSIPWLVGGAIDWLSKNINRQTDVLEFGAGASTGWLAQRAGSIVSIEGSPVWFNTVKKAVSIYGNARVMLQSDPIKAIESIKTDGLYDLILVDGRNRNVCIKEAVKLLKPGGYFMLDNSERERYSPSFDMLKGWKFQEWEQLKPDDEGFMYKGWKTCLWQKIEDPLWCKKGHLSYGQAKLYSGLVKTLKPQYVLEIGFCTGRATYTILNSFDGILKMATIDIDLGYMKSGKVMAAAISSRFGNTIIEGDSHKVLTKEFVLKSFPLGIDLIIVDGDHSYKGCKADIELTRPYLNQGGNIIIDDYKSGKPEGVIIKDVDKAVDEFKHNPGFSWKDYHVRGKGVAVFTKK